METEYRAARFTKRGWTTVIGHSVQLSENWADFVSYERNGDPALSWNWHVIETTTGYAVGRGNTEADAIEDANTKLGAITKEKFLAAVAKRPQIATLP